MSSIDIKFNTVTRQFVLEDSSDVCGHSELHIKFVRFVSSIAEVRLGYELIQILKLFLVKKLSTRSTEIYFNRWYFSLMCC